MKALCLSSLLLVGCATTGTTSFVSDDQLRFDRTKYADDAAVVLHRKDRTELIIENGDSKTVYSRHEVIAVLGEGGLELAEVRIPFNVRSKFESFAARVVRPDGSVQLLGPESLMSDTNGSGERDFNARFFRFPNVSVGCVLEYRWEIEAPWLLHGDHQDSLGEFPVQHYDFELTASKELVLETIELNGGAPIEMRTRADGSHTLRFELSNLPPRRRVDAQPHWTFTEPRWVWRVLAYKTRAYTVDWLRNWNDVAEQNGRHFFTEGKIENDFDVPLDTKGCADTTCVATRAAELVMNKTSRTGMKWNRTENLAASWRSGKASDVERALMVKTLLENQSLDVWLAYGTGKFNQQTMPSFPNIDQFDRLFVYLPAQKTLKTALVIDTACDACKPGEFAPEYAGTQLYVFKTRAQLNTLTTSGRWEKAPTISPPDGVRVTHVATLEKKGDVVDDFVFSTHGDLSFPVVERFRNARQRLWENEEAVVQRSSPLADLRVTTWNDCTPQACGWNAHVIYEREASRDGARWLVPTSFLRSTWEDSFLPTERTVEMHFKDPDHYEEVADLKAPEGYELVTLPPTVKAGLPGFMVEVNWERTPQGARVTRKLRQDIGELPAARYREVRGAVEAFRRARREVLVFAPRKVAEVSPAP